MVRLLSGKNLVSAAGGFLAGLLVCMLSGFAAAQTFAIHSHNDYLQNVPFWKAYACGAASIEVDVILKDGRLYAAHEEETILAGRTLSSLYLAPARRAFELGFGENKTFQLLIDIKTDAYPTLDKVIAVLEQYHDILQKEGEGRRGITVVISGNRPQPAAYTDYPEYIRFDHQSLEDLDRIPLQKVALISLPFRKFSDWDGRGKMEEEALQKVKNAIRLAHGADRPIRFWGTPDTRHAWKVFYDLGIDYINTDQPFRAADYLSTIID